MGCNEQGDDCGLGGSGGPDEACVLKQPGGKQNYSKCAPPVDTKFEATLGQTGMPCDAYGQQGCDYVDVSLVDGWTLPFKLTMSGGVCSPSYAIDCSGLTLDKCPEIEGLGAAVGQVNLTAVNPRTGKVAGCYSPCMKLVDDKWGLARGRQDPAVFPYCCPTPPLTPEACKAGPIQGTQFVQKVHQFCPGVYAFAYDDAMGTVKCSSTTQYVLTFFCPAGELPTEPTTSTRSTTTPTTTATTNMTTTTTNVTTTTRSTTSQEASTTVQALRGAGAAEAAHSPKCAPASGQCGGMHWMGPTCCPAGQFCRRANDYVSQCRTHADVVMKSEAANGGDGLHGLSFHSPLLLYALVPSAAAAVLAAAVTFAAALRRGRPRRDEPPEVRPLMGAPVTLDSLLNDSESPRRAT